MNKPNLIIPGFPKSGTSSLFDYLIAHNEIFATNFKEPHLYSFVERYNKRFSDELNQSFPKLYKEASKEKYIIDASTTYMISKDALRRIKEDTPDAKIIIIARDPIDRIESHYNWIRSIKIQTKPFKQEITEWLDKPFAAELNFRGNYKNYVEFSQYGGQIERCLNIFPEKQVLIIPFEKLKTEKHRIMHDVFSFLELEPIPAPDSVSNKTEEVVIIPRKLPAGLRIFKFLVPGKIRNKINIYIKEQVFGKRIKKYKLKENDKKWLYDILKNDIDLLDKLGYRFDCWKTTNSFYKTK